MILYFSLRCSSTRMKSKLIRIFTPSISTRPFEPLDPSKIYRVLIKADCASTRVALVCPTIYSLSDSLNQRHTYGGNPGNALAAHQTRCSFECIVISRPLQSSCRKALNLSPSTSPTELSNPILSPHHARPARLHNPPRRDRMVPGRAPHRDVGHPADRERREARPRHR